MANTFKVITKAGVTSLDVIYTAASGTTTVVLGLILGNTTTSQITSTVTLNTDTSNRSGANNEANQAVELVTNAPIPAASSLEMLAGNKVVLETTDEIKVSATGAVDVALSVMEITSCRILVRKSPLTFNPSRQFRDSTVTVAIQHLH